MSKVYDRRAVWA